jgi:predicted RNA-binding Zn-ribbon protein involved in translation (DUF1610 family)
MTNRFRIMANRRDRVCMSCGQRIYIANAVDDNQWPSCPHCDAANLIEECSKCHSFVTVDFSGHVRTCPRCGGDWVTGWSPPVGRWFH